jgi:hypothetical protein
MRAGTRADTAEFSWQAQKRGRYDGRYARYRDFQYLTIIFDYLRICSCIFHCKEESKVGPPVVSELHLGIKHVQTKEA